MSSYVLGNLVTIDSGTQTVFKVVTGTTQPTSPSNYMIWIKCSLTVHKVVIGNTFSGTPVAGDVWIQVGVTTTPLVVLDDPSTTVYTKNIQIYTGSAWAHYYTASYYSGAWHQNMMYIVAAGVVQYPESTTSNVYSTYTKLHTAEDTKYIYTSGDWLCYSIVPYEGGTHYAHLSKYIDLTTFSTISCVMCRGQHCYDSSMQTSKVNYCGICYGTKELTNTSRLTNTGTVVAVPCYGTGTTTNEFFSAQTLTIDISNVTGSYYVSAMAYSDSESYTQMMRINTFALY